MSEKKSERDKRGRSVLARCVVICIAAAIIGSLGIAVPGLAAQQTGDTVTVTVNAPAYVEETFIATIDVDSVTNFNSGQFDLSFDSSVVNVIDVTNGRLDGATVIVDRWEFVDKDTARVILDMPGTEGISGSGYLAKISFEVVGKGGDRSVLGISKGLLVDTEAEEIPAEWFDDAVIICPIPVKVNAPGMAKAGESFIATIDVDNIAEFNAGQFDLSFDPSVVNVTDVTNGRLDGATAMVDRWEFVDKDTVRVILDIPGITGISGSGYLAKISFEVVGKGGDRSVLDISNGLLVDTEAEEILTEWIDDEIVVGPVVVQVNAPERVKAGESFVATIDVDSIADLNIAQFDLSFDPSVVNVTDVANGSLDGEEIPVDLWDFVDDGTIRVIAELPGDKGVSGSGNLAKIRFEVAGERGDRSVLAISNGLLVNKEAREIPAEWIDAKIVVGLVLVEVNAPEMAKAGESFVATIDVDDVTDFNSGQFDLSFDSSVVNVTDVADGSLDGETIPVDSWEFVDEATIRVILDVPGITGVSGSGNLAKISFEVVGKGGDRSVLDISEGMLVNKEAREIEAEWIGDEIVVGPVVVKVNAPEMAKVGESFVATIDVDDIADFNIAQFDLSFDSSVVNVRDLGAGEIDGEEIPIEWDSVDDGTIRVIAELPGDEGVSGSGNLAEISFEVIGMGGDRSVLDISEGMLVNKEARDIPAEWIDDEIVIGPVLVEVNAPEMAKAGESFVATIDVDDIADFNIAQFDLSFDPSVVKVKAVGRGEIDGEEIPIAMWDFVDDDTIRVIAELPGDEGVSGSGCLAKIRFEVVGKGGGDRSVLDIFNGKLVNKEAREIPAEWVDDEIAVGPVLVIVNAPDKVKAGASFVATIDVDDIADFNIAQFDLSFDRSVLNIKDVREGKIDGEEIPIAMWDFVDEDTIRVIAELPGDKGVSGSGNLAKISFKVVGKGGDKSVLDISNGKLVNKEAREIPAEWIDDVVTVEIEVEKPSVTIETDKSVYKSGEKQIITLTIANPTSKAVQVKVGMSLHVYETGSDVDVFETGLIKLPAKFENSFELEVKGLELPEGKYAWRAYLKDAKGVKISESEAEFGIVASSISTVPSTSDAIFEDLSESMKQAVDAELL